MSTIFDPLAPPPLLTADLPGIGGRIKEVPEDFEVEEIPAYEPSGSGAFLYLWIEKRDMGAEYFIRQVARRLGISAGEVGSAGLKDRRAVTRQMISVPGSVEERVKDLDGDGIRVLRVGRHSNKLRPGHLHGNRFRIVVRGVDPETTMRLQPLLERLRQQGVPNYYGTQRLGRDGETVLLGLAMLRGEEPPRTADGRRPNVRSRFLRRLALSAAQSALFNYYLSRRLEDGLFRRVLPGDVMAKWPFGGLFLVTEVEKEQTRLDARETVTAGPMFGRKTYPAAAEASAREESVLRDAGLAQANFGGFGKLLAGTRRHNQMYPGELAVQLQNDSAQLTFTLPAGSYATVLLREILKVEPAGNEAGDLSE
jgi:tRNA pseudouridine13 synthase